MRIEKQIALLPFSAPVLIILISSAKYSILPQVFYIYMYQYVCGSAVKSLLKLWGIVKDKTITLFTFKTS